MFFADTFSAQIDLVKEESKLRLEEEQAKRQVCPLSSIYDKEKAKHPVCPLSSIYEKKQAKRQVDMYTVIQIWPTGRQSKSICREPAQSCKMRHKPLYQARESSLVPDCLLTVHFLQKT